MSLRIYRKYHLVGNDGITGVSAATLYRWIKIGKFPPPIHLSERIRGWPSDAVQAWLNARDAQA
jgi:predicted DNA-binding transcriptional regulator AlpA